jgi:hypothetical protein|tara:strand:+ start:1543 stop:2418 length:876 start_codon:yes stop_codon:yes gene_type:complete
MARGDNPMGMVILLFVCSIISSITGAAGWFIQNKPKEGDECEGDDQYGKFTIDSEGKCALYSCETGYEIVDNICVPKKKIIISPPSPPPPPPPALNEIPIATGRNYTIREYSTNPDEDGQGNMTYLVRHHVECGNDALNGFQLERKMSDSGSLDRIRYNVSCLEGVNSGATDMKQTTPTTNGDGSNFVYLDRQKVDCEDKPISEFQLKKAGTNKVRYAYKCSTLSHNGECRDVQTELSNDGGGNTHYLDRHDVKCDEGEAMTSFKLIRNPVDRRATYGDKVAYEYKCCKMA